MAELHVNPTPEETPGVHRGDAGDAASPSSGTPNTQTQVLSRSAASTYVVDRASSGKTMTREDYDMIAAMQDAYIAEHDMIQIDGYIGNDPDMRTAARLLMEKRYANIAGMQQKLYFERNDGAEPEVQGDLHARPGGRRLPRRPTDRRGPRPQRHARPELGLLR